MAAEGGDFFGAGDESMDAAGGGGLSEAQDLVCGRAVDADGGELALVHAGEDGDGEELGGLGREAAASAAAWSMAGPPAAWRVRSCGLVAGSKPTERMAPATVLGMSWSLRSRKTEKPRWRSSRTMGLPSAR